MKEKERGKNETEKKKKKRSEKKFQSGNRTRDLLICLRPSLPHSYRLRDLLNPPTNTENLNGDELRVASLAALAPPIIVLINFHVV